jgi:hypothetical protein
MATQDSINEAAVARLKDDISEIATILNSLRKLAPEISDDKSVIVETLAQKAGFLADRCLSELGETSLVVGDFAAWSARD